MFNQSYGLTFMPIIPLAINSIRGSDTQGHTGTQGHRDTHTHTYTHTHTQKQFYETMHTPAGLKTIMVDNLFSYSLNSWLKD